MRRRASVAARSSAHELPAALLFDCDGVLVDTERDGHRISFNEAFKRKGKRLGCKACLAAQACRGIQGPGAHEHTP